MKRPPRLMLALLAPIVLAWSAVSHAANCQNGKSLYNNTPNVPVSCKDGNCHGAGVNKNKIQNAAGNWTAIDYALDGNGANQVMIDLNLRSAVPLGQQEMEDLASWIFYAPTCPADVSANPASASFGSQNVGSTSAGQTITITNSVDAANATGMTFPPAPAPFARTTTCTATLAAGASCTITFTFSPTAAGTFTPTYTITGNPGVSVPITLSGTGASAAPNLQASPSSASLGSVSVGQVSAPMTITVTNTGAPTTLASFTNPNPAEFVVTANTCSSGSLGTNASCSFGVAYKPASPGPDNVNLTINYSGGSLAIPASGTGTAAAAASLSASPTSLAFGSVTVGTTSAAQALTVSNTGGAAAAGVNFVNGNAGEFVVSGSTCGASIAAGASCKLNIAYKPSAAGADNSSYTITHTGGSPVVVALSGTGAVAATANLQAAPPLAAFGDVTVGQVSAAKAITISNSGTAAATTVAFVNSNAAEFVVSGNNCGATLAAGASCTLNVAYAPGAAGADSATLTVNYAGGSALSISLSGTGVAAPPPPPGTGALSLPAAVGMPDQTVGSSSAPKSVVLINVGAASVTVSSIASSNPGEFTVGGSNCGTVIAGGSCTFSITFTPAATGGRSATITVTSTGTGSPQVIAASGNGVSGGGGTPPPPPPPTSTTTEAVEYYHKDFDHYFVTAIADEITKLDNGTFVGWARTGRSFKVSTAKSAGMNSVCRFFSTAFGSKSSHFYTNNAPECTVVKASPDWQLEDESVFAIQSPDIDGNCPAATIPVYRMYNDGQGGAPNHRFTTDFNVRAQMLDKGWIPEGAGRIGVMMCAPE